ncbi:lipoprotein-releasing ABC transporter permease subunit [Shewanella sp. JM162201]|uniref:Lipoprotein-releasing ABC transporter permease subunit n=1 Tax=Shewanella jiangmenensis TaxID=2837387 RepID=A0ABS5UYB1_9GAMM|nr:lipoprotein-releasing ABC transporter permease subunit [Shewanella jiangmenensis]MBT1443092.1 lipoprotein-releasing ABC transporter permease subunit [Shewanella jiangmenensis]
MFSSSAFLIGFRYWRARKANAFASFITLFAVSGIFLGVAALIVVTSVMNGLEGQLKERILGAVPQLVVENRDGFSDWQQAASMLKADRDVIGVTPSTSTQAMLQSSANIAAVQLNGVFPQTEAELAALTHTVYSSAFDALEPGSYRIILGTALASELDVAVGDTIRVLSGEGVVYSPLGPVPSQRRFVVAGLFQMGSMVDAQLAFVHYEDARRLMRKNPAGVDALRLYLDDPFKAETTGNRIPALLAGVASADALTVHDWRDSYGQRFGAVKMEKNMMSLMLSLIVAVAAFNIVSALVMMVVDKTTDVAVLMTQGLKRAEVMGIFVVQGSLNAVLGLVLGLAAGLLLALNLNTVLSAIGVSVLGGGQSLPVIVSGTQLGIIVLGTVIITLLATLYPALKASRVEPAQALRYE